MLHCIYGSVANIGLPLDLTDRFPQLQIAQAISSCTVSIMPKGKQMEFHDNANTPPTKLKWNLPARRPIVHSIHIVDAGCGRGKSYSTCQRIRDLVLEDRFIFVAPSIALIDEMHDTLVGMEVPCTSIYHDETNESVRKRIFAFLYNRQSDWDDTSEVHENGDARHSSVAESNGSIHMDNGALSAREGALLITWHSFSRLDTSHWRHKWNVVIDEIPQVDNLKPFPIAESRELIRDLFTPITENASLYRLVLENPDQVKSYLAKPKDVFQWRTNNKELRDIVEGLLLGHHDVFITAKDWEQVVEKNNESAGTISLLTMLTPRLFIDNTILGANIKGSMLEHWFEFRHSCKLKEHEGITNRLRPKFDISERLHIKYLLEGVQGSKYLFNKTLPEGGTVHDAMDKVVLKEFDSNPILYVKNNDRVSVFDGLENATKLPVVSNGLNAYQDFTNIYISAALNRSPEHIGMLNNLGISSEMCRRSTAHNAFNQCVSRTAIRDPISTAIVTAVVPDRAAALELARVTGAKQVSRIGSIDIEKPRPFTVPERKARTKFTKIQDLFLPGKSRPVRPLKDKNAKSEDDPTMVCAVTFHKIIDTAKPDDHSTEELSIQDFIQRLKTMSKAPLRTRDEGSFFNAAVFDHQLSGVGYRTIANFVSSSFMVLDFDSGELSPDRFVEIFDTKAGRGRKVPFVICNSFGRTPDDLNRFRVILFYKKPAKSIIEHKAVYLDVSKRLEEEGFTEESSGLDDKCKTGVQSFFVPCTNAEYPDQAFFICRNTKTEHIRNFGLDPEQLAKTRRVEEPRERYVPAKSDHVLSAEQVEALVAPVRAMSQDRHGPMFILARALQRGSLDKGSCRQALISVAATDSHIVKKAHDLVKQIYGR